MAKKKKTLDHVRIMSFNQDNKTVVSENAVDVYSDVIESQYNVFKQEDATRYVDENEGTIYYLFNVDYPAKVEAENLKKLRRSMTLTRMFDYDIKKPMDIFRLMPYLIIVLLVVFR